MSLRATLLRATQAKGVPSSDYDLNAERPGAPGQLREAAVLVGIVDQDEPTVVLTKRSSALKHHPGQIAFPGGKVEEADADIVAAALREAREEISLEEAEVIGSLAAHETVTGFNVTPVLAMVPPDFAVRPDPQEVAEVFQAPLRHLMNPGNYLIESRRWRGQRRYYYTVPWGPYYIWGATARMLRALADRMADETDQG